MTQFHVIKDPVYGSMQFSEQEDRWIKPFLDSHNFQRLRHIKQLGLADWIFPGAEHTRFHHSLGCCYVGGQICNKLGLADADRQIIMIACLLHDIGHGPFSHAFEELFQKKCFRHEAWTPAFLAEYKTKAFLSHYNTVNSDSPLSAKEIDNIESLIMGHSNNTLLSDIVSSQLDADRLDYLLRDNHFCGVTYGVYDFRWLLHCLVIIKKDLSLRLGVTAKGVGVVEQYLMARRLMIRNVYHNGKKHGGEFFLQIFLQRLAKAVETESAFAELRSNPLILFLRQVNQFNGESESNLESAKQRFIHDNYAVYKELCDYDIHQVIRTLAHQESDHEIVMLAKRLHARELPRVIYLDRNKREQAEQMIYELTTKYAQEIRDWQVTLIELPHLSYEGSRDPILIRNSSGKISYLHDDSLMVEAMSDRHEMRLIVSIDLGIIDHPAIQKLRAALQG